jgi:hypothetical protein
MPALERSLCSTSKLSARTCPSGPRSRCSHENLRGSASSTRCTANHILEVALTWSKSRSLPPGRSTRFISAIALRSSGMVHRESMQTTVSKEASGNDSCWASPSLRRVMHNRSDQKVGRVAQRSPKLLVEPLPAGIGRHLGR